MSPPLLNVPSDAHTGRAFACVIALVLGTMTNGCGSSPTASEVPRGTILASIDGVEFVAQRFIVATNVHGVLAIAAQVDDGRTIHLTMISPQRAAIVAVGAGEQNSAKTGYETQMWSSNLAGGMGAVSVTNFASDHVEGTFSYTAVAVPGTSAAGQRVVAGRFNVAFTFRD